MIALLLLVTSVSAASKDVSIVHLSEKSNFKSPYYADYEDIDWTLCGIGNGDAYCLMSDRCTTDHQLPKYFKNFDQAKINQPMAPPKPTYKYIGSCDHGIMIKPLSPTKWMFFVQFFAPNINQELGLKLFLMDDTSKFVLGHCKFDKEGRATDRFDYTKFTTILTTSKAKTIQHAKSYADTDKMMCIFSIEEAPGSSVSTLMSDIFSKKTRLKYERLSVEVTTRRSLAVVHSVTSQADAWAEVVEKLKKRSSCMLTSIELPSVSTELKRRFLVSKVINEFNSLACHDPLERLVIYRSDTKALHEVMEDGYRPDDNVYWIKYIVQSEGAAPLMKEITVKMDQSVEMACMRRTCISCGRPPMIDECDGCTPPQVIYPKNFRDCPKLRCRGDTWLFNDTLEVISRHEPTGISCFNDDAGVSGWFRSNDHGVSGAACDEYNLDCHIQSPLNFITCADGDESCAVPRGDKDIVYCPTRTAVLMQEVKGEWKKVNDSLHCCHTMGTWYLGMQPHIDVDPNLKLKCEVLPEPPWFDWDDPFDRDMFIYMYGGMCLFTVLLLSALFYDRWKCAQFELDRKKARDVNLRPSHSDGPQIPDISGIRDLKNMSDDDFWQIITDFQLYSVAERVLFVENMLNELGGRVDIDHFLALFHHCSMMESDHRVWRKLVVGHKMIIISFNQVNKSRTALRMNEGLKMCMHRVLNRIGYDMTEGEDESVTETRNIALHVQLVAACRHTKRVVLTDAALTQGREDIRRRRILFAFRARAGNMQENFKNQWEDISRFAETDKWYLKRIRDEAKERAKLRGGGKKKDAKMDKKKEAKKDNKKDAKKDKKKNKAVDLEKASEKNADDKPATMEERDRIKELHEQAKKWGTWREHMIYALCSGKNPEYVKAILADMLTVNKLKHFSSREVLAAFRASVEDSYDMRWPAKVIFLNFHASLKARLHVESHEYQEIFMAFARFAAVDFTQYGGFLPHFVQREGVFTGAEKSRLPLDLLSRLSENGRGLIELAKEWSTGTMDPADEDEEETEREEDPDTRWIDKKKSTKKTGAGAAAMTKQQQQPTSSLQRNSTTTKSQQQKSGGAASKSGKQDSVGSSKLKTDQGVLGSGPITGPKENSRPAPSGTEKKSDPKIGPGRK